MTNRGPRLRVLQRNVTAVGHHAGWIVKPPGAKVQNKARKSEKTAHQPIIAFPRGLLQDMGATRGLVFPTLQSWEKNILDRVKLNEIITKKHLEIQNFG